MSSQTIRLATAGDIPEVQRLVGDADSHAIIDLSTTATDTGRRYSLVLDDDHGGIAAAAVIRLHDHEATLELLAVEPRCRDTGIEQRMIGVAEALCDAFGCDRLVVPRAA